MSEMKAGVERISFPRIYYFLIGFFFLFSACQSITGPSEPELSVTPEKLMFGWVQDSLSLNVSNAGRGMLNWSIEEKPEWVTITPSSGTAAERNATVEVMVHRANLANGEYTDSLVVVSNGGDQTVPLHLTVDGPFLSVSNTALDFMTDLTGLTLRLSNIGNGTLHYQIGGGADWLQVSPVAGEMAEQSVVISVSVDRTALSDGDYTTRLEIESSANTVIVSISMNVPVPCG